MGKQASSTEAATPFMGLTLRALIKEALFKKVLAFHLPLTFQETSTLPR